MKTLIITRKEIEKVLVPSLANRLVEKAFRAYGLGQVDMPPKSYLTFKKGDLRSMPAYIHGEGFDIAGIKSVNVHPENSLFNLPTVMAVVIITDPETGFPLAVMDGTFLTNMRTGAAGAVATKYLAKEESETAGFVGCGAQARALLACTMEVRPLKVLKVWQRRPDSESARAFQRWAQKTYDLEVNTSSDIDAVSTSLDVLFTTTPSRRPLVQNVSPGTHINAMGADAEGKQEINPHVVKQAKLVVDDWTQALHSGEINVPVREKTITKKDIYADLGEIVAGIKKGRSSEKETTLFDSTGLAIQDIACAYAVYDHCRRGDAVLKIELF